MRMVKRNRTWGCGVSRHNRKPEGLFLLVLLGAAAAAPAAAADTVGDFIARKLRDFQFFGSEKEKPATTPRKAPATKVTINGRSPYSALSGRAGAGRIVVPLPRPRPFPSHGPQPERQEPRTAALPTAPVVTDTAGRVVVKPEALARERDHYRAVYLKPKEIGRWDATTVGKARRNCRIVLATLNVDASPISPIGGPQGCGIAAPVLVRTLGIADLKPDARLNCRFTAALYEWVRNVVQPAARKKFGQPVVAIRQLSHYACRRRGGISRGPVRISEHSFGNAIDIGGFVLANGKTVSVLKDWGSLSALFNRKAAFLKEVRDGACRHFSTVLSPDYNKAHRNHFHFDLGRGGRYRICK